VRIGIDYTAAVRQGGGIGRYTRNLIRALAELDAENRYRLFVAGGRRQGVGSEDWPSNYRVRSIPVSDRLMHIFWQRLRVPVPMQVVTGPLDLFHSPDFVLPPLGRTPAVVTVHDLSFLRVPDCYVPAFRGYLETAVTRAVRRADRILADSASTRQDLVELLAVEPERVTVLYPGVESRFQPVRNAEVLERVRLRYALPERFILSLSTLQPRKNFAGLVKGFGTLVRKKGFAKDWADLQLVIVGGEGWMFEDTFSAVAETGLEDRIHFTGFVDDHDLPALYSLASVFAFPTRYEGFGLPVLEAMACGTPVVTTDNSSLPEIVGDAGLLVDAGDFEALAVAMEELLVDLELRARLSRAGLERSGQFKWDLAAAQLMTEYQRFA
jgi:glycosyltransferase involved in cell wall biosynthesis